MLSSYQELLQGLEAGESFTSLLKYATNVVASFALYVTIALAAALVVWAIAVRNKDEQHLAAVRKTITGIIIGYSVGVITVIGAMRFLRDFVKGDITWHVWALAALAVFIVAGIVIVAILHKKGYSWAKWVTLAVAIVCVVVLVVMLIVVPAESGYEPGIHDHYDEEAEVYVIKEGTGWLMYLVSAILIAAIAVLALVGEKPSGYNTKSITYAAICISTSFALSYIKFFSMPQSGSITFASLLPLALYSFMFGTRKGVIAGIVYGLLQFIQSPQPYQMMQILLDYPIAFASIGLAGIGRRIKINNIYAQFTIGTTIAVVFRYISHVISGYFVYYTWAGDQNPLVYSLAYNSFTFVDILIVLAVGIVALSSKSLRRLVLTADTQHPVQA